MRLLFRAFLESLDWIFIRVQRGLRCADDNRWVWMKIKKVQTPNGFLNFMHPRTHVITDQACTGNLNLVVPCHHCETESTGTGNTLTRMRPGLYR
jgi:Fe-S-cluster-containing hydrogenase component 2